MPERNHVRRVSEPRTGPRGVRASRLQGPRLSRACSVGALDRVLGYYAVKALGITQPEGAALRHYKLAGFSVERLMKLLTALDQDVEIVIRRKPRSRKAGRISVVPA